ncbi:DUF1707 SHOCT-like domain-containing protein [Micropruina sonneratiae]|uniref:DUF1707 SHOCT-like domain-containing protein n=1 Tax=Micropruina sonneratiae TaxID=2986940 RepID=UPI0022269D39|nr:DUF1707 domain-containing protein [Micropruina sp. KQZ13P-5]MCW3157929.1 DUF1707 domain-containing protein [Micropruina sp. KQZ13P-5]
MTDSHAHLRVGHAQRDAAIVELRRAAAEGKLTEQELFERIAGAQAARTYGELEQVLADLRPPAPEQRVLLQQVEAYPGLSPTAVPAAPSSAPPGFSPNDPLVLNAGFTGAKRTGPWRVPPFLRVQALADTVRLDCLQAVAASEVIDLEVLPGAATVLVIVPEGWAVQCDRLSKTLGTVVSKVPDQASWGNPLIVARGSIGLGTFRARGANWFDRRRLGQDR